MSQQVLHLDFIRLTPETDSLQRRALEDAASQLTEIEGVQAAGVIEATAGSDFDMAFWFVLREFSFLEPFGTHLRYTQFLQKTIAPVITGFAGADVKLEDDFESRDGAATCLALIGPEEAYDFEVREALEAWCEVAGASSAAIGLAIGEKQLYRGAAIGFGADRAAWPEMEPFRATVIAGTARTLA